jgi:hypothetical protein
VSNFLKVLIFALSVSITCAAESTNFFLTLKVGDVHYTNVTVRSVRPSDIIISFDGGGAKVPLQKLTPDLQRRFGYDPDKASQELARQRQRLEANQKAMAQAQASDAWRGDPVWAEITNLGPPLGGMATCQILVSNVTLTVLLKNPPALALRFFDHLNHLKKDASNRRASIAREKQRLSNLEDNLPSTAPFESPSGQAIRQMNIDAKALDRSIEALNELEELIADLERNREHDASCFVRQTAKKYGGHQIWECQ